jgi:hypothetical protein
MVADISSRLERRIRADFPHHPNLVTAALAWLTSGRFKGEARDSVGIERIQFAALLIGQGNLRKLDDAIRLGRSDWRDLLVAGGLADEGWQDRMEAELQLPPPTPSAT